jgi:hypothetical protein
MPKHDPSLPKCAGLKRGGRRCTINVKNEGEFCGIHENATEQQAKLLHLKQYREANPQRAVREETRVPNRWFIVENLLQEGGISWAEFVKTMTTRELARGNLRAEDGSWEVRVPNWVPREFHRACMAELLRRGSVNYKSAYLKAIKVFTDIIDDPEAEPALKVKAAQYVWERIEGKVPERVQIQEAAPWQDTLLEAVVSEEEMMAKAREMLKTKANE